MENRLSKTYLPQRRSIRLRNFDYTQAGAYFITICAYLRQNIFGSISYENMITSPVGNIIDECWREIPAHFPHAELAVFVVMPNHPHGIIIITHPAGTQHAVSASHSESFGKPVASSLPTVIRSFKSATTKHLHASEYGAIHPIWQKGYYEHVIRTDNEFANVSEYIDTNPAQWAMDHENPENTGRVKRLSLEYR
ncbi:MAG: transposase [Dehalococcoidia bacterium]|nr:transposase [Dehalococcoidia bacterium]